MARHAWLGFGISLHIGAMLLAAPVEIRFTGVDASSDPVHVSLIHPATQERAWVKLGGRFAGCDVRAYDARKNTLRLARGDETWEIRLESAVIAVDTLSDAERAQIEKQVTNNLRQLDAAAQQFYLEYAVNTVKFEQLVGTGPNHYIKVVKSADAEDYTKLDFTLATEPKEWVVVTRRGVEVRYLRQ